MAIITDDYGTWEVFEYESHTSRRIIEPSQKYLDENPPDSPHYPTDQERISIAEEDILNVMEAITEIYEQLLGV